jgi:6-phosphogluconolactonase
LERIAVTLPLINSARQIVVIVTGAVEAETVRNAWCPLPNARALPTSLVKPTSGTLTWMLAGDAAMLLRRANFNTN